MYKHSSLLGPFVSYEENGPSTLEFYNLLGCKGFAGTSILAYRDPVVSYKEN